MRQTHDDLTGTDDLPRLRQSLDYHAGRVREQNSVTCFIASNAGLGLGHIELRSCGLGVSLAFVIGRCPHRTPGHHAPAPPPLPPPSPPSRPPTPHRPPLPAPPPPPPRRP